MHEFRLRFYIYASPALNELMDDTKIICREYQNTNID